MNTQDIVQRQKNSRKPKDANRTLLKEYLHYWYMLLITAITCLPGYVIEIFLYNLMVAKKLSAFASATIAIFLGGLISTLPFLILNIVLCVKKKKYYAIVVQIAILEIIGMAFFLYNQVLLAVA